MALRYVSALEASYRSSKHNLNPHALCGLWDLSGDTSITIKEAAKGGGIVILNTLDYENKVYQQVNICLSINL